MDDETFSSGGITFNVDGGGGGRKKEDNLETNSKNPNCFAWCLMNLCISKILQQIVRKMVNGIGLELLGKGSPMQHPQCPHSLPLHPPQSS